MTASSVSASTSLSGKWSEISTWVRYPRVLPSLIRVFRRERRRARSSSDRTVSSRPNSFISARSLALLIFMRSGLTFSTATVASGTSSTSPSKSASTSDRSVSSLRAGATTVLPGSALWLPASFGLGSRLAGGVLVAAAVVAAAVAAGVGGFFRGVLPAGAAGLLALAGLLLGKSLAGLAAATLVCSAVFFTGTALAVLAAGAVGAGAGFFLAAFAGAAGGFAGGGAGALGGGGGGGVVGWGGGGVFCLGPSRAPQASWQPGRQAPSWRGLEQIWAALQTFQRAWNNLEIKNGHMENISRTPPAPPLPARLATRSFKVCALCGRAGKGPGRSLGVQSLRWAGVGGEPVVGIRASFFTAARRGCCQRRSRR